MRAYWIKRGIGIGLACIAGAFLLGYAVMGLWNWLMPPIFGLGIITYWQAFGLLVLGKILFGGWHRRGHCWGGHCGHHGGHWRHHWKEKWEGMSEEDRAKFRERCGSWWEAEDKKQQ